MQTNGQLKPHSPTIFSCIHQEYNIWVHDVTSRHADKPPYVTMQNVVQRGLFFFSPLSREQQQNRGQPHLCRFISTQTTMHHLVSWLYIIPAKLISFPLPCFVCQDKMSLLELLLWNPWAKRKRGEKCTACEGEIKMNTGGILWWVTLQNHPVCLWDCCVNPKLFLS